jgi:hypothetical protein
MSIWCKWRWGGTDGGERMGFDVNFPADLYFENLLSEAEG